MYAHYSPFWIPGLHPPPSPSPAPQEALWTFLRGFADEALAHVRSVQDMLARAGRPNAVSVVGAHPQFELMLSL